MREMWVIAKRELYERVRSKWFIAMTVLWPVLMVGAMVVPALLGGQGTEGAKVTIVDRSGVLAQSMSLQLAATQKWQIDSAPPETDEKELRKRIKDGQIDGYVMIPSDALDGGEIIYSGNNASNQTVAMTFGMVARSAVIEQRAKRLGMAPADLVELNRRVNVSVRHTTGEEEGTAGVLMFLVGFLIAFLMYSAIMIFGMNVMRSVITEKTSRIVELLVATSTPRAMMAGKILGVGTAGLIQIAIWFGFGALAMWQQDAILGLFGVEPDATSMLPSLTAGQVGFVLVFFVFGYLFYAAMYAAVGAMVSSDQDSQQAQMPITMLLVLGIIAVTAITSDPRGATAQVMTMVPFWSPMLMPLRYFLGGAGVGQVVLSLALLAVSTVLVALAAAKIYRVGILMYGKRPSVRELVRWLRY